MKGIMKAICMGVNNMAWKKLVCRCCGFKVEIVKKGLCAYCYSIYLEGYNDRKKEEIENGRKSER